VSLRTMRIADDLPFIVALLAVAISLWLYPRFADLKPLGSFDEPGSTFVVTSAADSGPGSLRDALFRSLRLPAPSVVVLQSLEIRLETPLPPLASTHALSLKSLGPASTIHAPPDVVEIPVLDVRGGAVDIENVTIRGAAGQAIRVATRNPVRLTEVVVADSAIGLSAAEGHRLEVASSRFVANRIGIELLGFGSATISAVTFEAQRDAGIWAVGPPGADSESAMLDVARSRFRGSRYGIVAANVEAHLRESEIEGSSNDGILVLGGTLEMTGNRIHRGAGAGVRSSGLSAGLVARNEVFGNAALGILLEATRKTTVEANQVYRNGYGIVALRNDGPAAVTLEQNVVVAQSVDGIVAIGDSPAIIDNHALRNTSAGIRIFDLSIDGSYFESSPLLRGNVLEGNGIDGPVHSLYTSTGPTAEGPPQ
jgi:Right handed beta helix region